MYYIDRDMPIRYIVPLVRLPVSRVNFKSTSKGRNDQAPKHYSVEQMHVVRSEYLLDRLCSWLAVGWPVRSPNLDDLRRYVRLGHTATITSTPL